MTIRYTNGQTFEAVLMTSTATTMRLAVQGSDDVLILNRLSGVWVSDDCEPVDVSYAWSRGTAPADVKVEDCICSHERAAHLIHMLYAGGDEPSPRALPAAHTIAALELHQVV